MMRPVPWPSTHGCTTPLQVRNNEKQHAGKILADARRINVALTRAKLKLVMLGAQRTLCSVPTMQCLWEHCRQKGWTLPVLP